MPWRARSTEPERRAHARVSFIDRLTALQVRRPVIPLLIALVLAAISAVLASRLTVATGFEALLPEKRASVKELDRVAKRTTGISSLFVVLEGGPETTSDAMRRAGDALVTEIGKIGPPWVGSVEDGLHEAHRFLLPRAGLFADKAALSSLRDDIDARYAYEVNKALGTSLDDDEPPPALGADRVRSLFHGVEGQAERYPDGYYQSKDGRVLVVAVRSKVMGTDLERGQEAIRRVREVVESTHLERFDPAIHWGFTGDLVSGNAEYAAIHRDLTEVGVVGSVLIAAVVFAFYLRVRTLVAMLATIGVGLAWTFGMTQLAVGRLNMATGFLFSIVAGNGINFAILFMTRYVEARSHGADLADAVRTAHRETWRGTLTAAAAAAAAYGSLATTEFRGFRDFGFIGGLGMILCWIATYWTLPAILAAMDRVLPLTQNRVGLFARIRARGQGMVPFSEPFAALVVRFPRVVAVTGVALAVLGFAVTARYAHADPMEYDVKNLRTEMHARAEEVRLNKLAESITGHLAQNGMAILVDDPAQIAPLRHELEARRDRAPANEKPFAGVHSLGDFVPADQAAKIPILLEIKDKLVRAEKRGLVSDDLRKQIATYLPPDDLRPFGIADLPEGIARAFTETDGTRGRIVYISPIFNGAMDDAHYLLRWADSYRETHLPDGSVVRGSGRAVIYADMWSAILADVPKAVAVSAAATVLVVLLAFRASRAAVAVLFALLVGVGWMGGILSLVPMRLNFLNFIALPITFGIGVDYAVNIVQRYRTEGTGGVIASIRKTGGAVILCSMTTTLGYFALVGSQNHAVRSLGIAAVVGEATCLLAAVLVLPAALLWLADRRRNATASEPGTVVEPCP
ncbi:exporters of the RND superfamily protein [Minicystis rosea]|nr:exporters of the RND superfamily protein [Minicystis rosea]